MSESYFLSSETWQKIKPLLDQSLGVNGNGGPEKAGEQRVIWVTESGENEGYITNYNDSLEEWVQDTSTKVAIQPAGGIACVCVGSTDENQQIYVPLSPPSYQAGWSWGQAEQTTVANDGDWHYIFGVGVGYTASPAFPYLDGYYWTAWLNGDAGISLSAVDSGGTFPLRVAFSLDMSTPIYAATVSYPIITNQTGVVVGGSVNMTWLVQNNFVQFTCDTTSGSATLSNIVITSGHGYNCTKGCYIQGSNFTGCFIASVTADMYGNPTSLDLQSPYTATSTASGVACTASLGLHVIAQTIGPSNITLTSDTPPTCWCPFAQLELNLVGGNGVPD